MTEKTLPAGWAWTTLGDVVLPVAKTDPASFDRPQFKYIDISAVDGDIQLLKDVPSVAVGLAPSRARQLVRAGDTVFSTVRPYLRKIAWLPEHLDGEIASTGFCVLRPSTAIESRFLFFVVTRQDFLDEVTAKQRGVSYPAVRPAEVLEVPIPLPPLPEQHRIVEALEDHLSRLEAAELTLGQAKARVANLSRKAINFSCGMMTSAADSALPPTPADVVDGDLPYLSPSWSWRRLGELAEVVGGITKDAKKQSDESFPLHPYLRVANVQAGHLNLDQIAEIRATPKQVEKLTLHDGDVLLNEGGDRDKLGRGWIWENQIPNCLHQNHVFRARVDPQEIDPRLIAWHANSFGRSWFMRNGKQSVNLASVSLKTIKAFPVPVPPPEEQESIVERITTALESHSRLQAAIDVALARSAALRRSLLGAAFNGELVDQSPTDEPAEVALAKIRDQQVGSPARRRQKVVSTQ